MRVYKLLNHYIDLDHVLVITDVVERERSLQFEITLAFQDKPWEIKCRKNIEPDGDMAPTFRTVHANFLEAWQNTTPPPTITVTEHYNRM
jgi:hypothetical protein